LPRLFISHSSKDNVAAIAFKQWLGANDWPDEDVFLDLDSIGAGARWKEALRKANASCEAVILLASPNALASSECIAEVRRAEDYGKEIVVVVLRDLQIEDRRLDSFRDRQIVDLAAPPQSHIETVSYRGERREVHFNAEALASIKDFLFKRGIAPDSFAWPSHDKPNAEPFPGLSAFTEEDAGIFFGRDSDILRGLDKQRFLRRNGRPRAMVIQAASGAGKSSYLRAGLWPRLNRDSDYAPVAILRPAQGILTGPEGLGRKLAARLSRPVQPVSPGEVHAQLMADDEAEAATAFTKFMVAVATEAHEQRRIGDRHAHAAALIVAVDQAEELFEEDDKEESQRFLFLLSSILREPPAHIELFCLFTIRSDGAARLFQTMVDLGVEVPEALPLLPLPHNSYREVILRPLDVLARGGQRLTLSPALADRLVTDATGADALPLLAFTISHLYREFSASGSLTLEQYESIGGVAGSLDMALKQAVAKPRDAPAIPAAKDEQLALLRTAFIPWLARVDPETGAPLRRVARLDEFSQNSRAIVERLIKARLLVVDRRSGVDVVEIAHESLLRQWPVLTVWLQADADDLKLVDTIERAAAEWDRNGRLDAWLDHRGSRLAAARNVLSRPDFRRRLGSLGEAYLESAVEAELLQQRRARRRRRQEAAAVVLLLLVGAILVGGWLVRNYLKAGIANVVDLMQPQMLSAEEERSLVPGSEFTECVRCPTMVVVPAGSFLMGARNDEGEDYERPQHNVTFAKSFAVAKFVVTFDAWDACVAAFACSAADDQGWDHPRGTRPVINVNWDDAQAYAAWLSRHTGKRYRLLSEAEFEYAARAGTLGKYPWGEDIGVGHAICDSLGNRMNPVGCGTEFDGLQTGPVGRYKNNFGLYDMHGNVWEWVADCLHRDYRGAPDDGSAWTTDCVDAAHNVRVLRGGSWYRTPDELRSAHRFSSLGDYRDNDISFRLARDLD
jgi:formylglycine-generating enzyme required for sulfatase activity